MGLKILPGSNQGSRSLLFISFKWSYLKILDPLLSLLYSLKQLICYKQPDQQSLDLVQVKAHDIRAFMASKSTFNCSISQAIARTMQDLSEVVFISMANFTLARRDSYLEYLHAGVKQDMHTALRTALVHLQSLFPDQFLSKAEEEVCRSEERRSSSQSHRKPNRFHPYASNDKSSHQLDRKSTIPALKQIRECQQGKIGRGKPSTFSQKPAKGSKQRK